MKKLDLATLGVEEMSDAQMREVDGGNQPVASYLSSEQIASAGQAIRDAGKYAAGFLCGFFGIN